jgi:hypothetical protein
MEVVLKLDSVHRKAETETPPAKPKEATTYSSVWLVTERAVVHVDPLSVEYSKVTSPARQVVFPKEIPT